MKFEWRSVSERPAKPTPAEFAGAQGESAGRGMIDQTGRLTGATAEPHYWRKA